MSGAAGRWRSRGYSLLSVLPEWTITLGARLLMGGHLLVSHAVVLDHSGRLLLVRSTYRPHWSTPGGFVDRGEDPEVGALRELREEVGLALDAVGPPEVWFESARRRVHTAVVGRWDGDPSAVAPTSPEIAEVRWFHLDGLPDLKEDTAEVLRRLEPRLRSLAAAAGA